MSAEHGSTVRKARKLAWRRIGRSEARNRLALAEALAAGRANRPDHADARRSIAEAQAILDEGGMRLCEVYRDISFPSSDLSLGRYGALERARRLTAVRVCLDGESGVWWYGDGYYLATPGAEAADIERFARMEEHEERRRLERFRARVARMTSSDRRSRAKATAA